MDRRVWIGGILAAVMLVGGVTAIAIVAVPDRRDDVWIELAKAGIQLLVVIGLGAIVGAVVKSSEAARDQRRQRDERRFAMFSQIVSAYHRLKFVRRNLRMVGIRSKPEELRPEQVEALRNGMGTIAEVELELEEVMRALDARSAFEHADEIGRHLYSLAEYVGELVSEWEQIGECFWPDRQSRTVAELPRLQAFLGKAADDFRPKAATPMGYVEWIVRGELPEGREAERRAARQTITAMSEDGDTPGPDSAAVLSRSSEPRPSANG